MSPGLKLIVNDPLPSATGRVPLKLVPKELLRSAAVTVKAGVTFVPL
jgi:hypothetical protein